MFLHLIRAAAGMTKMQDERSLLVFSGNANKPLADSICRELGVRPGKALVSTFSDGEVQVEIEENVRRQEVFVIQPTCAPAAENLMELLVIIDALKRASAASVTAVVPYFGYSRQDRRLRSSRVPITAKVAAKMFTAVGTDRVLTVDLHADQIQGFFDIPVDNVTGSQLDELVVTDTIPLSPAARACGRIRQVSVAELLAETIRRIAFGESVSSLYVD